MGEDTRVIRRNDLWVTILFVTLTGCGTVGAPVAPEDVGIGPLIERQKKVQAQQDGQNKPRLDSTPAESPQLLEPVGQDEELPSLRPVGGR